MHIPGIPDEHLERFHENYAGKGARFIVRLPIFGVEMSNTVRHDPETPAESPRLPVFELATRHASLEEAFMQLTDDSVDYRSHSAAEVVAAR